MWIDNASEVDILFYEPYAKVISEIALNRNYNPLTIGVFGAWGAGKSTLLKVIEHKIADSTDKEKSTCVTINAWSFEGYEDAKIAIMESLLQELHERAPEDIKKKVGKLLKKVDFFKLSTKTISVVAPLMATENLLQLLHGLNFSAEEIGTSVKKAAEAIQAFRDNYLKADVKSDDLSSIVNNVRKFRSEFEESLGNENIDNVIVLIDDLDRCQPDRIIETLEAIKLFLAVNKTTFIIAADENVIQYAIYKKYPPHEKYAVNFDQEYIEKIIHLPIYIPELSSRDVENYLMLLVVQQYCPAEKYGKFIEKAKREGIQISEEVIDLSRLKHLANEYITPESNDSFNLTADIIDGIKSIVAGNLKGNPRQAKRFLNTFTTKQKLAEIYYGKDKINPKILAKLLVLQKLDENLFLQLNEWNKYFTTQNEKYAEMRLVLDSDVEDERFKPWMTPSIRNWVKSEPVNLEKERLDRYFYLTRENLKKTDVDDSLFSTAVKDILQQIEKPAYVLDDIITHIEELTATDQADVFRTILPQIEQGKIKLSIVKTFFTSLKAYRAKIVHALINYPNKITLSDEQFLKEMRKIDQKQIDELLDQWKNIGRISAGAKNRITQNE